MKYYRIENDVESKAVGRKYPQLECNTLGYAHAIPDFGPSKIKYNLSFNLVKGTKLTDALSTTAISASGFIISKRLRTLLESYKLERHEFIPVEIIDGKQTHNYYFLHFYGLDMVHCLDYQQSEFHIIKWGFQDLGTKKFDSYESYQNYMKEFNEEYSLIAHLDCVVLKEEFNDLDVFSFPYFGNEVFISERLKQCLEDNHITGFSFEEKFQLYKVTDLLKLSSPTLVNMWQTCLWEKSRRFISAGRTDLRLLSGDAFSVCKKRSPLVLPNFRAQTLFACYRKDARIRQHIISGVCNSHFREARKIKLKKQKR